MMPRNNPLFELEVVSILSKFGLLEKKYPAVNPHGPHRENFTKMIANRLSVEWPA